MMALCSGSGWVCLQSRVVLAWPSARPFAPERAHICCCGIWIDTAYIVSAAANRYRSDADKRGQGQGLPGRKRFAHAVTTLLIKILWPVMAKTGPWVCCARLGTFMKFFHYIEQE